MRTHRRGRRPRDPRRRWYYREADRAAAEGRINEALQLAFVGLALTLEAQGLLRYHPSKTPAECAREADLSGRRSRATSRDGPARSTPTSSAAGPARPTTIAGGATPARSPGMRPRTELGARGCAAGLARRRRGRARQPPRPGRRQRSAPLDIPGRPLRRQRLRGGARPARRPRGTLPPARQRTLDTRLRPARRWSPFSARPHRLYAAEGADDRTAAGRSSAGRPAAAAAMRCLGYDVVPWRGDSVAVRRPAASDSLPMPLVRWLLRRRSTPMRRGFERLLRRRRSRRLRRADCPHGDTLLRGRRPAGRAAARACERGRNVTLVSDDRLFTNRLVRESAAGAVALGLVVPRYRRVVVDEYHHGFDASGSLAGATFEWSCAFAVGLGRLAARRRSG